MNPVTEKRSLVELTLLKGSTEFFPALIAAMDLAQTEILLETYIFDFTAQGEQVAQALERAAHRGVLTRVMVDGVGTESPSPEWQRRLDDAGVEWRVFAPLGRFGMLAPSRWRRLHRKLCCVDQRVAFCGGINILDDYFDPNHGVLQAPRFDFAVQVTGRLVDDIYAAICQDWMHGERLERLRLSVGAVVQASRDVFKPGALKLAFSGKAGDGTIRSALVLRDNLRHRSGIEQAYRKAISQAKSEVIIANAYFVPGRKLRQALVLAARRGVRVQLLLQGKYEYFMQYYAARPVYGALLAAGVEIHEYSASFLHAKVAVVDGSWSTVGSSNLDPLSLLLAREANVSVQHKPFAEALRASLLDAIVRDGDRMDPAEYAERPLRQRCFEWTAYALMRVALKLQNRKYL
jgi:cardiolipin synthase